MTVARAGLADADLAGLALDAGRELARRRTAG